MLLALFRNIPLDKLLAQYAWNILTTQELLALPLFILMGEILFQSAVASLFQGLAPWAGLLPGRLLHVNVVGCTDLRGDLRLVGRDHAGGRPHGARPSCRSAAIPRTSRSAGSPAPARSAF